MALVGDLAAQSTAGEAPGAGLGQSVAQGLDAGLAFAAAQQKSDLMGQQLDDLKQQQSIKTNDYMIDGLSKAAKATNPQMRKIMLQSLNAQGQKLGLAPIDDDMMKALSTDEGANNMDQVMSHLNAMSNADDRNQAAKAIVKATGAPYVDAIKQVNETVNSMSQSQSRSDKNDMSGQLLDLRRQLSENTSRRLDQADDTAVNRAVNSPQVQAAGFQLTGANKALSILDKGIDNHSKTGKTITWSQMHEVMGDMAGLTAVKPSAGISVGVMKGLEADQSKLAQFMGELDREASQAPSETVPIENIKSLKEQIANIRKVAQFSGEKALENQIKNRRGIAPDQRKQIVGDWHSQYDYDNGYNSTPQAQSGQTASQSTQPPQQVAAATQGQGPLAPTLPGANNISAVQQTAIKNFKNKGKTYNDLPAQLKSIIDPTTFNGI